jgi:hypothetical protein
MWLGLQAGATTPNPQSSFETGRSQFMASVGWGMLPFLQITQSFLSFFFFSSLVSVLEVEPRPCAN